MPLEEVLPAVDAVRHADHRARPTLHMRQHPLADRLIILRQLELGHRLAVVGIGPERLLAWEIVTPIMGVDPRGAAVLVWIVVGAGSFNSVVDANAEFPPRPPPQACPRASL